MIGQEQLASLRGADVYDRNGDKIGSLGQVYLDTYTNQPAWASVNTGFFGLKESMVPVTDAEVTGDGIRVPYDKATVKDAPNVDVSADEPLMDDEVSRLYQHYGVPGDQPGTGYDQGGQAHTGVQTGTAAAGATGYTDTTDYADTTGATAAGNTGTTGYADTPGHADTTGATAAGDTDSGYTDDAMTRSEERLNVVGTERQQVGRARLRKYIVTEHVQTTVPVRREEVRLEREPVTGAEDAGDAYTGADITESEHEMVLHAERPVVHMETVPVERVRLSKETVTDEETVTGEVRKERIEADLPDEGGNRPR
jgi:uncharacterized protein (TIGR02271 family)